MSVNTQVSKFKVMAESLGENTLGVTSHSSDFSVSHLIAH